MIGEFLQINVMYIDLHLHLCMLFNLFCEGWFQFLSFSFLFLLASRVLCKHSSKRASAKNVHLSPSRHSPLACSSIWSFLTLFSYIYLYHVFPFFKWLFPLFYYLYKLFFILAIPSPYVPSSSIVPLYFTPHAGSCNISIIINTFIALFHPVFLSNSYFNSSHSLTCPPLVFFLYSL